MVKKTMQSMINEFDWSRRNAGRQGSNAESLGAEIPMKKSSQKGLQEGWSRATFILKKEYIEKLKALSYWERTTIKEIIDDALSCYLKDKDVNY